MTFLLRGTTNGRVCSLLKKQTRSIPAVLSTSI